MRMSPFLGAGVSSPAAADLPAQEDGARRRHGGQWTSLDDLFAGIDADWEAWEQPGAASPAAKA